MCIDIVDIWFKIANWQIMSIFEGVISPHTIPVGYYHFTFLFDKIPFEKGSAPGNPLLLEKTPFQKGGKPNFTILAELPPLKVYQFPSIEPF